MLKVSLFVLGWSLVQVSSEYIEPGPKYKCPKTILNKHICTCVSSNDIGLNILCQNTNLATLSVSLADISSSQTPIEKLHLNHCNISRLYGDLFYSLDIKSLVLENIPLMGIDDETFLGINETLHELVIVNSMLDSVPVGALKILGHLKRLVLDNQQIEILQDNTFQSGTWSRNLEKLSIINGKLSPFTNVVFTPLKKLKHLDLHGNNITDLKKNQFKGMKNIDFLDLSFNGIKKIDGSHIGDLSNLGWLNISHNAIEDLGRSIFARNNLLKVLNLGFNRIKKIDVNTFRGMRLIRRLFLNNNNISDVGRSTFSTMTRIGTIDLSYNFIKKIDFQMFYELNYVDTINVSHNKVTEIEKFAFKDLYHVDILLSHNQISKIQTNAFVNCANITMLDMSSNTIETFSRLAFDELTFALHFNLAYNKLKDTAHVPLSNMTGIKILNVSHNEIVQMSRNTFPKLYELHTIDISHNQLVHISNAVMQPLLSLRFLNFTHNSLEEIKSETFGTLPTVLDLKLDHNELSRISRGAFTKLSSLSTLGLTHNKINTMFELPISLSHLFLSNNLFETIPSSEVWPSMNALLSLDLSYNMIGNTLTKGSFYPLLTLQSLDLNYNNLSVVPWEALSDFTSLRKLNMQGNQVTKLNKAAFGSLPVVFDLDMSRNAISNVSVKAFEGLLQLINLDLSHNNIESIPNGAFQGLVALNTLDISYNYLEFLDNKTNSLFEDCLSLKNLYLSHNKISFLTKKSIPYNQYYKYKLENIDLSYNAIPVLTFDFTFGTKDIKKFNLSHNQINEVRRYVLGNFTSLHVLDLSYNEISNLHESHVFKLPSNLTHLDLSHNLLSSVPLKEILNTTDLLEINFEQNKFTQVPTELFSILNRTRLRYANNPLICDCYILPLYKWLHDQLEPDTHWVNTNCILPQLMSVYNLTLGDDLPIEHCSEDFKTTLQNVNFRTVNKINKNKDLYINWYVNNPRTDIGDVQLKIKQNESVLLKRQEHYNSRYDVVKLNKLNLATTGDRMVDVCLMTLDSRGESYGDEHCMRISKAGHLTWGYSVMVVAILLNYSMA
uniref:Insulin-like growth factor-binding protein complex acid labile subunit n=1 Tax=Cacopsylla melanoneura TaxID=428564 RepID=A0A8D9ETU5_9HEMI